MEGETKGKDGGGGGNDGGKGGVANVQGGEETVAQWVVVVEGSSGSMGGNEEKEPILQGFGAAIGDNRSDVVSLWDALQELLSHAVHGSNGTLDRGTDVSTIYGKSNGGTKHGLARLYRAIFPL